MKKITLVSLALASITSSAFAQSLPTPAPDPASPCNTLTASQAALYVCTLDETSDQSKAAGKATQASLCIAQDGGTADVPQIVTRLFINGTAAQEAPHGYLSGNKTFTASNSTTELVIDDFPENAWGSFNNPEQQFKLDLVKATGKLSFLNTYDPGFFPFNLLAPEWLHYVCKTDDCDGSQKHDFSVKPIDYQFNMNCTAVAQEPHPTPTPGTTFDCEDASKNIVTVLFGDSTHISFDFGDVYANGTEAATGGDIFDLTFVASPLSGSPAAKQTYSSLKFTYNADYSALTQVDELASDKTVVRTFPKCVVDSGQ